MYPHERSLVKRLADELFSLVGVNSDPKDVYLETIERENITWPSFWDGGDIYGPVATKWNVYGWPTIYIIDHKGIIRARDKRGEVMDEVVELLLAEMKK